MYFACLAGSFSKPPKLNLFGNKRLISSTKHKRPISNEGLEALYAANQLGVNTPESLVNRAWFYTILYFRKRGRENQRAMRPGDLKTTTSGLKYFVLRERATKNQRQRRRESICDNGLAGKSPLSRGLPCGSTWQKEIRDAMPVGRNRKTAMQALSIQQIGFVMNPWGSSSWRIS